VTSFGYGMIFSDAVVANFWQNVKEIKNAMKMINLLTSACCNE